jgi:gamma-glutamyltranspeptidase/glutathione hydrolase
VDAAAAAHFALMVTDPANTSLGGRVQILIARRNGELIGVDGATRAPFSVNSLRGPDDERQGFQVAPVPGAPAALAHIVSQYGRLSLADVIRPAIALARDGFVVTQRLADTWQRVRDVLAQDAGAAQHFLKKDGRAYSVGEMFRQPALAQLLDQLARSGVEPFYRGAIADVIAADAERKGGFIGAADLRAYEPLSAPLAATTYRGYEIAAVGGRAWGDTLVQMFNMLEAFSIGTDAPTAEETEILARVMGQALSDRPQEIGTLKPKPDGYPPATLSSRAFGLRRAGEIRAAIAAGRLPEIEEPARELHDTTHVAVMDREGNAVSLTTSIGPSFGARVASPSLGFLYAHSYRMRADPSPGARDETEMTPTIVRRDGRPILAIGAAGSERIPTAILQVASHVLDKQLLLERAIAVPRIYSFGRTIRAQSAVPVAIVTALRARGFSVAVEDVSLGTVHAVQFLPAAGAFLAAADPIYDGTAAAVPR